MERSFLVLSGVAEKSDAVPPQGWASIWGDEFSGGYADTNQYGFNLDQWSPALPWDNCGDRSYRLHSGSRPINQIASLAPSANVSSVAGFNHRVVGSS